MNLTLVVAGSNLQGRRSVKVFLYYCASDVFSVTEFEFEGSSRRRKFEKWKKFKVVLVAITMYIMLMSRRKNVF